MGFSGLSREAFLLIDCKYTNFLDFPIEIVDYFYKIFSDTVK